MLVTLLACSASQRSPGSARTDRTVITAEQLAVQLFENAFVAIESLRSNWLRAHGPDSFSNPSVVLVYYDNMKLGGTETLRTLATGVIASIKRYDGLEATARWGVGHGAGVIAVTSWAAEKSVKVEGPDTASVKTRGPRTARF